MKSSIILGYFTCILMSVAISNAQQEVSSVNSPTYNCYNILNANIDSLLGVYKTYASTCVTNANAKRGSIIGGTGNLRSQLETIIASVAKYFNECALQKGAYFYTCLAGHFDANLDKLIKLRDMALNAINTNNFDETVSTTDIDEEERKCIADAVDYYKSESNRQNQLFTECITTGFKY
ncbi:uncharacterized protein LOC129952494 [Eupeodes corollae]|uniref:uncharacterized protein LOC129952494 n=1 Tax=Eupeodes corollae TaxID=290404 RepID=UPI0024912CD9|nr:uncharacterized protein LOC129952494 [Eupeodes corollae]